MYAPHARIPVASQAQEQGARSQSERCAVKKLTAATERKQRGEQRGQATGWLGGPQEWARGAEEVGAAQDIFLTAALSSRCAQTTSLPFLSFPLVLFVSGASVPRRLFLAPPRRVCPAAV
jgi:hypothetical protein